jgi:hypothetical protein
MILVRLFLLSTFMLLGPSTGFGDLEPSIDTKTCADALSPSSPAMAQALMAAADKIVEYRRSGKSTEQILISSVEALKIDLKYQEEECNRMATAYPNTLGKAIKPHIAALRRASRTKSLTLSHYNLLSYTTNQIFQERDSFRRYGEDSITGRYQNNKFFPDGYVGVISEKLKKISVAEVQEHLNSRLFRPKSYDFRVSAEFPVIVTLETPYSLMNEIFGSGLWIMGSVQEPTVADGATFEIGSYLAHDRNHRDSVANAELELVKKFGLANARKLMMNLRDQYKKAVLSMSKSEKDIFDYVYFQFWHEYPDSLVRLLLTKNMQSLSPIDFRYPVTQTLDSTYDEEYTESIGLYDSGGFLNLQKLDHAVLSVFSIVDEALKDTFQN